MVSVSYTHLHPAAIGQHIHCDLVFLIKQQVAVVVDLAAGGLVQAQQGAAGSGLATTGLAYQMCIRDRLKNDLLALFAKFALFDGQVRQKPALHLRLPGFWAKLATKTMPTQIIKMCIRDSSNPE